MTSTAHLLTNQDGYKMESDITGKKLRRYMDLYQECRHTKGGHRSQDYGISKRRDAYADRKSCQYRSFQLKGRRHFVSQKEDEQ